MRLLVYNTEGKSFGKLSMHFVPRSESFAFRRKAVALLARCQATAEKWSAVNSNFQYGGRYGVLSEVEIEKYSVWKEKKAVQIGL